MVHCSVSSVRCYFYHHPPAPVAQSTHSAAAGRMRGNLPKQFFRVNRSFFIIFSPPLHVLFFPYLYAGRLISLLQRFLFCSPNVMLLFISSLLLFWNNKSLFGLFLSRGQANVCFLFRLSAFSCHNVLACSLSLPSPGPCYVWQPKTNIQKVENNNRQ